MKILLNTELVTTVHTFESACAPFRYLAFKIEMLWNFDKMQIIFEVITGSSGHAFCTALMETFGLVALESIVPRKRYLLRCAKVPYIT